MSNIMDIAVIGGGPAGYVSAIKGAQLGGKVILFERDNVGGTCLNRGCVPTKTFVKSSDSIKAVKEASICGIHFNDTAFSVNINEVVAHKNAIVNKLTGGVITLLKSNGVAVIKGNAVLKGNGKIICAGEEYIAKNIIICCGSKPQIPLIPGADSSNVITSNEALNIAELPKKLVIVGAGIIGCEFAISFSRFGSEVTIIESENVVAPMLDKELSDGISKGLKESGVKVLTSTRVDRIKEENGRTIVEAGGAEIETDKVIVATGREPVLDCLNELLEKPLIKNGHIVVDEYCRTSINGIFACGDVTDKANLASAAFKMGECAAANAMGKEEKVWLKYVPNCIHSAPEAASVGLTEKEARGIYGEDLLIGKFPFNGNGMALASNLTMGFVKVLANKKYGEILGVHILGANACEMIAEVCALLTSEITVFEVAETLHPHPSYSEAFMEACADALGKCIHLPKRRR